MMRSLYLTLFAVSLAVMIVYGVQIDWTNTLNGFRDLPNFNDFLRGSMENMRETLGVMQYAFDFSTIHNPLDFYMHIIALVSNLYRMIFYGIKTMFDALFFVLTFIFAIFKNLGAIRVS